MTSSDRPWDRTGYLRCVGFLLSSDEVKAMKRWRHHFSITCYEHSLYVSQTAYRLAARLGWDSRAAARAGLLHDLYLYDPTDHSAHPGIQCLDHPVAALRNARALCPDLSEREANAILTHMWPLAVHLPRCREAVAVNLADKACSVAELYRLFRAWFARLRLRHIFES
ncbi:MAG: HD domain-containing protein [Oscillospiraceae bacterium]